MRLTILAAALTLTAQAAAADTLTVLTYDSFTADWGPGPAIKAAFEKTCDCTLKFVTAGDGAALLARVQLEGRRSDTDVVVGLDTNLTARAAATGLFAPTGIGGTWDIPGGWSDKLFLPYDWGYFAFVYDKTKLKTPPHSFTELAASKDSIIIEDPRSSTPGLGLLLWVKKAYGDKAGEIWKGLADNIVTVTPGWDQAYGMFLKGEADMVLSYTTSPDYHRIAEKDDTKAAAIFDEGQYMQIEVMGMLASSKHQELAKTFLAFMGSDAVQSILPTTNWMYPAKMPKQGLPEGYAAPIPADKALIYTPQEAADIRDTALQEWQQALAK